MAASKSSEMGTCVGRCRFLSSAFSGGAISCRMLMNWTVALIATIVVATFGTSSAHEQAKPDLSGIWTSVKDAPAKLPLAPSAILDARFEIRHKGNTFTMVRPPGAFSIEAAYDICGPEVRMRSPG